MDPAEGNGGSASKGVCLESLYRAERDRVFAICLAILRDHVDAEDATQETFARVVACAGTLVGDPRGYITTTARNVCIDELRRRSRRRGTESRLGARAGEGGSIEDAAMDRQTAHHAWQRLAEADRRMVAYVFAGLSLAEIAVRLEMTAGLVSVRLFRARQRMRRMMPAPAFVAAASHPRAMLQSLLRRARAAADHVAAPLLARLQGSAAGAIPIVLGVASGTGVTAGPVAPPAAVAMAPDGGTPVGAQPTGGPGLFLPIGALPSSTPHLQPPSARRTGVPMFSPQFYPSQHYAQDHTLYANQPGGPLYRTGDGGRDWQAVGNSVNGQLLMPPTFPTSPTLYAMSDNLERSDDAGHTFRVVRAVLDTADGAAAQSGTLVAPVIATLPPMLATPIAAALDAGNGERQQAEQNLKQMTGDIAAVDPDSTVADTRLLLGTRGTNLLYVYDSALDSMTPFMVTPDQQQVADLFVGPGAQGIDVVVRTAARGWSVFLCSDGQSCIRQGGAPDVLQAGNMDRAASPTFSADSTLWYLLGNGVRQVTIGGADLVYTLPARWDPFVILPDARYATTHVVEVIAGDITDGSVFRLFRSVHGGPFTMVEGPPVPPDVDVANLVRLTDGSIVGTRWDWSTDNSFFTCSTDGAASWRARC